MISLEQVTKLYDENIAIENLSVDMESKSITVLLGKVGSGKSTTIKIINKLTMPEIGQVFINDLDISEFNDEDLRRKIGYLSKDTCLFPHMNVIDNISIISKICGLDKLSIQSKAIELMELVELPYDEYKSKYPKELTKEEIIKVSIARALASEGEIVLMDEPFANLNEKLRLKFQKLILEIQNKLKKTIVFATDDVEEAIKLGDKIIILADGKLEFQGNLEKLMFNPKSKFINDFLGKDFYFNILSKMIIEDYMIPIYGEKENVEGIYTINKNKSLKEALAFMLQKTLYEVWVADDEEKIVGKIGSNDIIKALTYYKGDKYE